MSTVVPAELTGELAQILFNLTLEDNETRLAAEKSLNERLAQMPDLVIIVLGQFTVAADTEVMRSFSLVLLRRFLFRSKPSALAQPVKQRSTLYGELTSETLTVLEGYLLHSLSGEPAPAVRKKSIDLICDFANEGVTRGRKWHALQANVVSMVQVQEGLGKEYAELKVTAFKVFAGCPSLAIDLQPNNAPDIFQQGLQDNYSIEVRQAALLASVAYLAAVDVSVLPQVGSLVTSMFESLHVLACSVSSSPYPSFSSQVSNYEYLCAFLNPFISLCTSRPTLFIPHLPALIIFLPVLIRLGVDGEAAGMEGGPSPPDGKPGNVRHASKDHEEIQILRLRALEFMICLSETMPSKARMVEGWVQVTTQCCLEGMAEFGEGEGTGTGLEAWLAADPSDTSDDESPPVVFEQALARLTAEIGGFAVLPCVFQHIPSMMRNTDWRMRHAGVMAVAAVICGTGEIVQLEYGKFLDLVTLLTDDPHPRVRYAVCTCIGMLCAHLEEICQEKYCPQLFSILIPALKAVEARVQAAAAVSILEICDKLESETFLPYLDAVVQGLLGLLDPAGTPATERLYVQTQAVITLRFVADAGQHTFVKHYPIVMPWLFNVLRNLDRTEFKKLRARAMECAGCVAAAVGVDVFRPDAHALVELLILIGNSADPDMTTPLMSTWANICHALGLEFEPYLSTIIPALLTAARADADVSVYDVDEERREEKEGWQTINMDDQTLEIRTAGIEDKYEALQVLSAYCPVMGSRLAPYMVETLEICLSSLRFYFHHGVREISLLLIPKLLDIGKSCKLLTDQMVCATFHQLTECIKTELLASFVDSLYQCLKRSILIIGDSSILPRKIHDDISESATRQLKIIADRRNARVGRTASEYGEHIIKRSIILDHFEGLALQDIEEILKMLDVNHPLLVTLSSVKNLASKRG